MIIDKQKEAEQNRLLSLQGDQALALKKLERRKVFTERWDGKSGLVGDSIIPRF
ncbi:MAG: hypothetical protein NT023_20775 [Armatimonadetes bacterium]|nr:hypothetical protein [Armatimonadota bacterium]